jgi:hypothetical protein
VLALEDPGAQAIHVSADAAPAIVLYVPALQAVQVVEETALTAAL